MEWAQRGHPRVVLRFGGIEAASGTYADVSLPARFWLNRGLVSFPEFHKAPQLGYSLPWQGEGEGGG
jgi:hypothetical protein